MSNLAKVERPGIVVLTCKNDYEILDVSGGYGFVEAGADAAGFLYDKMGRIMAATASAWIVANNVENQDHFLRACATAVGNLTEFAFTAVLTIAFNIIPPSWVRTRFGNAVQRARANAGSNPTAQQLC